MSKQIQIVRKRPRPVPVPEPDAPTVNPDIARKWFT